MIVEEPDAPLPPPENNVAAAAPAAPPSISEQQQIQDDAEASGMTARLPAGGGESQPADGTNNGGE